MKRSQIIARRRLLIQEWRKAKQHLKDVQKEMKETEKKLETVTQFIDLKDNFNVEKVMTGSDNALDILSKTAVWIVSGHEGNTVNLTHFHELVHRKDDNQQIKTLKLTNILSHKPLIGSDGLEVSLQPGELVAVTAKKVTEGIATHIANVGPSNEAGQLQHEYAKFKLGLAKEPVMQNKEHILQLDGQFRKLISDMKKGNDVNN